MPKQPAPQAGSSTNRGKPVKIIQKTADLMQKGAKGKGKENAVFGELNSLVKETKSLPAALQVEKFAKIRALEILAFQNAIKSASTQGTTRVFQSLPRHLRRRAASHNPRRVPKRYRRRAALEIDAGDNIAKIHRKRARLRRKGNLRGDTRTAQLLRRQVDKQWLPTHLYHAKRFHMATIWGYRLALTPTLKSFRPAYRASQKRAIVSDTSYFGTVELEGGRADLVAVLGRMMGGAFCGSRFENGSRTAEGMLYHPDSFPLSLIGPVEILWCAEEASTSRVWIRIHPSIFVEAFDALRSTVAEHIGSSVGVQVRDLREDIGSFEIVGPQGGRSLRRILRICRDESALKKTFFADLGDPSSIPRSTIAGFRIYDPRLHFPPPSLPEDPVSASFSDGIVRMLNVEPSPDLASTELWDSEIRESIISPTHKKSDLDKRKNELKLPGTRLHPLAQDDRLPVLLVVRDNAYTLMFPRGWGQALLHSVVYTGTLLGGLEERRNQSREAGLQCFPEHFSEVCPAAVDWQMSVAKEDERRWCRKPPGKRLENPTWVPDWDKVLGLSEEQKLNGEKAWLFPPNLYNHVDKAEGAVNAFRRQRGMKPLPEGTERTALVQVKLEVQGRGSPGRMAQIFFLDTKDRARWIKAVDQGADRLSEGTSEAQTLGGIAAEENTLIGYTTTGNFSLSRGHGFALGSISLRAWNELSKIAREQGDGRGVLVKIRTNGGSLCRLARLDLV